MTQPPPVVGKQLSAPIFVGGELVDATRLQHLQQIYPLTEVEYVYLRSNVSVSAGLAVGILGGWIGYAISLGPKVVDKGLKEISGGEAATLVGVGLIAIISYVLGRFLPSDKGRTLASIGKHFEESRPNVSIVRRNDD